MITSEMKLELAKAILQCVELRETSYDHAAAHAQSKMDDAARTAPNAKFPAGMLTDYSKFYRKTLRQACQEACPELIDLLYPMLTLMWNDATDWANDVLAVPAA